MERAAETPSPPPVPSLSLSTLLLPGDRRGSTSLETFLLEMISPSESQGQVAWPSMQTLGKFISVGGSQFLTIHSTTVLSLLKWSA